MLPAPQPHKCAKTIPRHSSGALTGVIGITAGREGDLMFRMHRRASSLGRVVVAVIALFAVLLPSSANAAAEGDVGVRGRAADVISSLRHESLKNPDAAEGLRRWERLPRSQQRIFVDYVNSGEYEDDLLRATSLGIDLSQRSGKAVVQQVGRLSVEDSVIIEGTSEATLASEASSTVMAAARTWYVSVTHQRRMGLLGVPIIWYYHKLHYNHDGSRVTATRGCEAWHSGWTGAWSLTPYPAAYVNGGLGFCTTRWNWRAAGNVNLNFNFRMAVDHWAIVRLAEWK